MNDLKLKGLIQIDNMEFHHIEGGFDENKRSMLVKEIAEIHDQPLGEINRRINDSRKRFKDGIDILDIKANGYEPLGQELGFSKQSFNQSRNIYVLSERGYSKLLKILEDDLAWEQYDKLVNGYFNMRKVIKEDKISPSIKVKEIEARYNNSLARKARLLEKIANDPTTTPKYRQVLHSKAVEIITGQELLPLPKVEKTYTAGEIAKELGTTANMIGRIANVHNLKIEKYGQLYTDKSPYSNKQVETWRYNEAGRTELSKLVTERKE